MISWEELLEKKEVEMEIHPIVRWAGIVIFLVVMAAGIYAVFDTFNLWGGLTQHWR